VRLLIVTANFRPRVGGIERFSEILAMGLARRKHTVTVLCCRYGGAPRAEHRDNISIVRVPAAHGLDDRLRISFPVPSPLPLMRALRAAVPSVDVVHANDVLYPTSLAALIAAHRFRVPSVLTQHVPFVPLASWWGNALQRAALVCLGPSARLATKVVALNPAVARWAESRFGLEQVDVLPVGVPHPNVTTARSELRQSFGLPVDRFIGVFIGRDVPKKGLDIFLAASDPSYLLVAVTDRQGEAENVVFLPFMSPGRIMELLACADAFVLPSETEGFPMTIQEALASGLPVVTTAQPGFEHFLSSEDALFVDRHPESVRGALHQLRRGDELRQALSARSRLVYRRHFDEERFVTMYERLYTELST
jgi:D-inositol-3-phosphate glycosyltransferase